MIIMEKENRKRKKAEDDKNPDTGANQTSEINQELSEKAFDVKKESESIESDSDTSDSRDEKELLSEQDSYTNNFYDYDYDYDYDNHENNDNKLGILLDDDSDYDFGKEKDADAKEEEDYDDSDVGVKISAENITAGGSVKVAETINEIRNFFIDSEKETKSSIFSISYTTSLPKKFLSSVEKLFVYPDSNYNSLYSVITTKRILLLTGCQEYGKYFTSTYLASSLLEKENIGEILVASSLSNEIRIDLFRFISDSYSIKNTIIIFKNIFEKRNLDIIDFFHSLEQSELEFLSKKLIDKNSFIIFTAETNTFKDYELSKTVNYIKRDIADFSFDILKKGFLRTAKFSCADNLQAYENINRYVEEHSEILNELGSMSKIAKFIRFYFEIVNQEEVDLQEAIEIAIEQVYDIEKEVENWFRISIERNIDELKNFKCWSFAFCLALFNRISWIKFIKLHTDITTYLYYRESEGEKSGNEFIGIVSEDYYLSKCKSQIVKDMMSGIDIVEFTDVRYSDILFQIFLKHYRTTLITLIPYLIEMAKDRDLENRILASRAIGRIGEIDPYKITFKYINSWSKEKENYYKATVGYLFEGILKSKDEDYRNKCLELLSNMTLSSDLNTQWTAIATYKQIGIHDLELSIRELRKISERIQSRSFKNLYELHEKMEKFAELGNSLNKLYESEHLLAIIRYSIVALSIITDPIRVFEELQKWISEGETICKTIVVLFFLGPDGIAENLENRVTCFSDSENKDNELIYCNIMVYSISVEDKMANKLVDFIINTYRCFNEFSPDIQRLLKQKLINHLERWTMQSLNSEKLKSAMKRLIVSIYNSGTSDLREKLWDSINKWKSPDTDDYKFDEYIDSIATQIFFDFNEL